MMSDEMMKKEIRGNGIWWLCEDDDNGKEQGLFIFLKNFPNLVVVVKLLFLFYFIFIILLKKNKL